MRRILNIVFFILILGPVAFSQKKDSVIIKLDGPIQPLDAKHQPLFIIDNSVNKGGLPFVNPNNVLAIYILKDSTAVLKYGKSAINGAIEVITKSAAILVYQNKLSAFSKEYRKYLQRQENKDDSVAYIVDGGVLTDMNNESIKTLYSLAKEKILKVRFTENPFLNGNKAKYLAVITTKQ